mgnify:CR=1 FL=1
MGKLPATAKVVIIGAGIVGNSLVYHLARLGWRDIVLLDKDLGVLAEGVREGRRIVARQADVRDIAALRGAVAEGIAEPSHDPANVGCVELLECRHGGASSAAAGRSSGRTASRRTTTPRPSSTSWARSSSPPKPESPPAAG